MSEIIHRLAHPPETPIAARFIAEMRLLSYDLEPGTPAYVHMVEDIQKPGTQQYQELDAILQSPRDEGFVRAYTTAGDQLALLGVGKRGDTTDQIVHLFARPEVRGLGYAAMVVRSHRRWAERDQSAWVLATNELGLRFWRRSKFEPGQAYLDDEIGLKFVQMVRAKRKRNAA